MVAALAVLAAVVTVLLVVPRDHEPAAVPRVVGETEVVRITAPNGETVEELALIDTGASSSSIDEEIAEEDLGLDLEDAPTVEVSSALGVEVRPLVDVDIQVAGRTIPAQVNVSDRSDRDEKVLLGREQLVGYRVAVGRSELTSPDQPIATGAAGAPSIQASALAPTTLLAMLPLCALLMVLLRLWVGLSTPGTFGAVLLGIGYVQSGVPVGLRLTLTLFVLGLLIHVVLRRSALPDAARLWTLIAVVATLLAQAQSASNGVGTLAAMGVAIPLLVATALVATLWQTWDEHGPKTAARQAVVTLCASMLVAGLLLAPGIRDIAKVAPAHFALACLLWTCVAAGCYQRLRLTELLPVTLFVRSP